MKRVLFTLLLAVCFMAASGQVVNKAVVFTGSSTSKASFGNITQLNGVSAFSFDAWVYINTWQENSYIFSKIASTTNRIDLQLGTASNKRLYFHISNNVNAYAAADNSSITVGAWHHIVVAYNGSQSAYSMIKVYIDGTAVTLWYSSGNGTLPTTTPSTTAAFELGNSFDGKLDEVRIWNTALASTDIDRFNTISPYHSLYSNLICYWRMDQNNSTAQDYKSTYNGTLSNASFSAVTDNTSFKYRKVCSYIRSNYYESGQISNDELLNNNDLVYIASNPYANGDLYFTYPIADGTLTNTSYLSTYNGRSGVLGFNGSGASMSCSKDLLINANAGATTFTFASWVYIDTWNANSFIFRKYVSNTSRLDLQLGAQATSTLYFHVSNGTNNYIQLDSSGLTTGAWHHVAVTYNGAAGANQQVKIYIDGVSKTGFTYSTGNGLLPTVTPFIKANFQLGVDFSGKFDETSLNSLSLSATEILNIKNNPIVVTSWNQTKTTAYWQYDDSTNVGKDSRTWLTILQKIQSSVSGYSGLKLRLGITGGDWLTMCQADSSRKKFAGMVRSIMQSYSFDGVDLDFEWASTTQDWTNYSALITTLKDSLPSGKSFSVSLHPLYYKISTAAITAVDWVTIQSYGPNPTRFPYTEFTNNVSTMLTYGFPKTKLVMGLPFFAVATDNSGSSTSYNNITTAYPSLNPSLDTISMVISGTTKNMTFNGQTTIKSKTDYVRTQDLAGTMSWDVATDDDISQSLSLQRALNSKINANTEPTGYQTLADKRAFNDFTIAVDTLQQLNKPRFLIYPNPARDRLTIAVADEDADAAQLFTPWGKKALDVALKNSKEVSIDVQNLPRGIYYLILKKNNVVKATKTVLLK